MATPNLLDLLGIWPTLERIVDYFRGWDSTGRRLEAEVRRLEAVAEETEAKARQATAEAARTEVETIKDAIELAKSCGFAPEKLSDEGVAHALLLLGDMAERKRILSMRIRSDRDVR